MPPAKCSIPYVVTVHDLIHLHYGTLLQQFYFNQIIRRFLHNAALIFTDSEYSREEILEWSALPSERVRVIPLAVSDNFCKDGVQFNPGYPYILYVGNRKSYKNIHRLITAFSLGCKNRNIRLVFSGNENCELLTLARKVGVVDRIVFLGRIKEQDLPAVYRGAVAVAYVSLYEGFGLPPLEAMACGTPVLTSNVTSLPEVVGDAGLQVNPLNIEEIADGLRRLTEDVSLHHRFRQKGLQRACMFNWDITAKLTWMALQDASQSN